MNIQTHISILINVRHILFTICGKAVRRNFFHSMYNRFGRVHLAAAFHNTMWHEVSDSNVRHAVCNVHRSFVGTFRWLQDIWRVTAGFPRRYCAASTRTTNAGSEQSRRITSVDWRRDRAGPGTAAMRSRPTDGWRSCDGIRAAAWVGTIHDLDELSALEHEQKVGVALKKARIQLISELNCLTKTAGKH